MNKTRMAYFKNDDIIHFAIADEPEAGSVKVSPNITAELNAKGELITRSPSSLQTSQVLFSCSYPVDYIMPVWDRNKENFCEPIR